MTPYIFRNVSMIIILHVTEATASMLEVCKCQVRVRICLDSCMCALIIILNLFRKPLTNPQTVERDQAA